MTPKNDSIEAIVAAYEELMQRLSVHRDPTAFEAAVTMPQLRLLVVIATAGEIHQSELVDRLGVTMSTVSGLVDRLVDHGYVSRHDDPADRRQVVITLTPAGGEYLDRLRELGANQLRRLLSRLEPADLVPIQHSMTLLLEAAHAEAVEAEAAARAAEDADVTAPASPDAVPAAATRKDA